MVEVVRKSFSEILHELTWLEDSTKKVAQEKVCSAHNVRRRSNRVQLTWQFLN